MKPCGDGRDLVPLLAGDLARLAADADVVSVKKPTRRLVAVGGSSRPRAVVPALVRRPRRRYSSTSALSAGPRGRRPGRMSQVATLYSEMCTLRSSTSGSSSLAASPVTSPLRPQW